VTTTEEPTREPTASMERRVATLLQQAEQFRRHGEDGEADAALFRAADIIMKHGVDAAAALARFGTDQAAVTDASSVRTVAVPFKGIYRAALVIQFNRLARAFWLTGRSFISRDRLVQSLYLVGYEDDVRQLRALIASVQLQADAAMRRWWLGNRERLELSSMDAYKARRQFLASFVAGATERVDRARRTALGDAGPGTSVVLASRQRTIDAVVEENFSLTTLTSRLSPGTAAADAAGYAAGLNAATGDTPVTTNRRQLEA
jgi:hypothetical protein